MSLEGGVRDHRRMILRLDFERMGIGAGIDYLAWTRERFPDLPVGEQLWFALGAYNAGAGHVRDGRRLARKLDLDGSLWFDIAERAMLKARRTRIRTRIGLRLRSRQRGHPLCAGDPRSIRRVRGPFRPARAGRRPRRRTAQRLTSTARRWDVIASTMSAITGSGRSWPRLSISTYLAPGMAAAVSRPASTGTKGSALP